MKTSKKQADRISKFSFKGQKAQHVAFELCNFNRKDWVCELIDALAGYTKGSRIVVDPSAVPEELDNSPASPPLEHGPMVTAYEVLGGRGGLVWAVGRTAREARRTASRRAGAFHCEPVPCSSFRVKEATGEEVVFLQKRNWETVFCCAPLPVKNG